MTNLKMLIIMLALLLLAVATLSQVTVDEAPQAPPLDTDQSATENQTPEAQQTQITATIKWVSYINLTGEYGLVYGTCIFGDYVAVVGEVSPAVPYVFLLDRVSGNLVKSWNGTNGMFYECLSIEGRLYVVGHAIVKGLDVVGHDVVGGLTYPIYMFDNNLNLLKRISTVDAIFYSITYDGEYIYVGGITYDSSKKKHTGLIEKRTKQLDLVKSLQVDAQNWTQSRIKDIAVNPSTGEIWALGVWWTGNYTNVHYFLVIFNKSLEKVKWIEYQDQDLYPLLGITFDDAGNAYVVGIRGVAKFDKYGNLMAVNKKTDFKYSILVKITYLNGYIYVFGEYVNGSRRQVLYILDSELNLLATQVLSKDLNGSSWFYEGRPSSDGRDIYVAGVTSAFGNWRWVVYAIRTVVQESVRNPIVAVVGLDGVPYLWVGGGWVGLGGFAYNVSVSACGGRVYVVVRGGGNTIWWGYYSGGLFSGWRPLPGATPDRPATAVDENCNLYIAVRGMDNAIYWGVLRPDGSFTGWQRIPTGSTPSAPAAAYAGGRLYIAVRGFDNAVWITSPSIGRWVGVGGVVYDPVALAANGTVLTVVARGTDSGIYTRDYTTALAPVGGWQRLPAGTTPTAPSATYLAGRLIIAVRGMDDGIYIWDRQWTRLPGATKNPPSIT